MCGIAGFISQGLTKTDLHAMSSCISHRGPDAEGFFYEPYEKYNTGLGHRRLSIIDLSEAANQPMISHSGRYTMIFNGEIFNYNELKKEKLPGLQWRSSGDTEVVLECYERFGAESFAWLNGMFALAIWDKETRTLIIARDHIGIKPLYYYLTHDELIFGSELKAITTAKKNITVNRGVVPLFFHLGYIPHPFSIYNNVQKLGAGAYAKITISTGNELNFSETSFWKIQDRISKTVLTNEQQAKNELDNLLTDAVGKQLVSDVPIGTFLSGGTDSSIVTALAAKVSEQKIKTYSIAVTDGKVNEAPYAAAVASHIGTEHHELPITQKEILEMVPGFIRVYDEPFTDSSAFPTMLVSKLARNHVTVTLSGDGGDELFLGYGSYLWAQRLKKPLVKLASPFIHSASKLMNNRYKRIGMMFMNYPEADFKSHVFSQDQYLFSEKELSALLVNPAFDFLPINKNYTGRELEIVEQMSFWDMENYLKDDLLVKVDRASMRYGLETRVPLLDYRVVEFSLNLSPSLKIDSKGTMKYLLKEVLYDYVPRPLLERPKWGFSIPLVKWLKTDLKWLIDKYCSKPMIEKAGIVHYHEVKRLVDHYLAGKNDYLYNRIWAIIVLHWFFDEHI